MEHRGCKDGLDRMPNGVPEVYKVAKAGLALVDGDNVGLDTDGPCDNRKEELLGEGTCGLDTSSEVGGWCLDRSEDLCGARLKGRKFLLIPDCGGLQRHGKSTARSEDGTRKEKWNRLVDYGALTSVPLSNTHP